MNSLVLKKVVFKIYASFFTLIAQTFTRDFELLSNQVSSNFIASSTLNYAVALGIPFLIYLKNRYRIWKCGCLCKTPKSKIHEFKKRMLHKLSDGLDETHLDEEFESVFDNVLLTDEQREKLQENRAKRIRKTKEENAKAQENTDILKKMTSIHPSAGFSRNQSELPRLNVGSRNKNRARQFKKYETNVKDNNINFAINRENNVRRRLGEGKSQILKCWSLTVA